MRTFFKLRPRECGRKVKGKKEGLWVSYYRGGRVWKEETYSGGVLHGRYLEFHTDGHPKEEGQYLNGERSGRWASYWKDGGIYISHVMSY